jgi:hypothetical protein
MPVFVAEKRGRDAGDDKDGSKNAKPGIEFGSEDVVWGG